MTEKETELSRRLVVGHRRDGRCCYDKEAKRELVEACMRPGISIARTALQHGVNANLLRKWIGQYQHKCGLAVGTRAPGGMAARSAFVPVVEVKTPAMLSPVRIGAQFPNGVKLDLSELGHAELSTILHLLNALPCSGLTLG